MSRRPALAGILALGLGIVALAVVQQLRISARNFGGADEWLLLDLSSRGVLGVPYAHRPLVLLWQAVAASVRPGSLAAFWAMAGALRLGTGLMTCGLALRLAPGQRLLALMAGAFAVAWTPLDHLRLDTVLICGYEGVTLMTVTALVVCVDAWQRRSPALLAVASVLAMAAGLSVESVVPVLAVAPALWASPPSRPRRFLGWAVAWEAVLVVVAWHAMLPLLGRQPSYQTNGIGLDATPAHAVAQLLQLLGMQLMPLFTSNAAELRDAAVAVAVAVFAAGFAAVVLNDRTAAEDGAVRTSGARETLRVLGSGVLLATAAHAAMSLTTAIRTPARTQILSGPGFALALAAAITVVAASVGPRWPPLLAAAAGSWVIAVGTGRVAAMQADWDRFRSAYRPQAATVSQLTAAAPGLRPGTLVLLVDAGNAWPMTFTFRHALRYVYGEDVVGVVDGANDFLYPWAFTAAGVVVDPWPVIRRDWQVAPSLHRWDTIVVAVRGADGRVAIAPRWPEGRLPPLPRGATYAPEKRVTRTPVRERERRVLVEATTPMQAAENPAVDSTPQEEP